jgi:hypothetical protein
MFIYISTMIVADFIGSVSNIYERVQRDEISDRFAGAGQVAPGGSSRK